MELFASEMRARRFWLDKPLGSGSGRFWLGWLYEGLSDFGRSIWRPFVIWAVIQILAALVFFVIFIVRMAPDAEGRLSSLPCISGDGAPLAEAALLSLSNGTVIGSVNAERIKIAQACLFGVENDPEGLASVPKLPVFAALFSILQTVLSAIALFLIGLSIRNDFRIQ
jgi:hypothetical protein